MKICYKTKDMCVGTNISFFKKKGVDRVCLSTFLAFVPRNESSHPITQ